MHSGISPPRSFTILTRGGLSVSVTKLSWKYFHHKAGKRRNSLDIISPADVNQVASGHVLFWETILTRRGLEIFEFTNIGNQTPGVPARPLTFCKTTSLRRPCRKGSFLNTVAKKNTANDKIIAGTRTMLANSLPYFWRPILFPDSKNRLYGCRKQKRT